MKTVLKLLIAVAIMNATARVGYAAARYYQLKDESQELVTFGGADHAFFNDTGARFHPAAAAEAWRRTLNWFDAHGRGRDDDDHDEDDD